MYRQHLTAGQAGGIQSEATSLTEGRVSISAPGRQAGRSEDFDVHCGPLPGDENGGARVARRRRYRLALRDRSKD
jgi:hypothetical protein